MKTKKEIAKIISQMSAAQKAGQLFLLAFPGKNPEVIRPLIKKYGICGCYISQDNAETFAEASKLTAALQEMSDIPLLLGVDQEGAWGVLVPESHPGPGNLALGATNKAKTVSDIYAMIGREMTSVGYNAVLGPCADVNSNPKSPIIGTRSFGEFPERVSECVSSAVKGAFKGKIVPCLKHFPGHGATSGDTHRVIPVVDKPLSELLESDLAPFKAGIEAGVPMVMTSHIRYPQIDPENPATLSKTILQAVLRGILGFKGVILSDSMNMGAIRNTYDAAESTLLGLLAGVDVIMLSEEHYDYNPEEYLEKQINSLELVTRAIEDGTLPKAFIDEKLARILNLKFNQMIIRTEPLSSKEYDAYAELEVRTASQAICLVQGHLKKIKKSEPVVCINATPRSSYKNMVNPRGIGPNQTKPAFDTLKESLAGEGNILFFDYEERRKAKKHFVKAALIYVVTEDYPLPGEDFDKKKQQAYLKKLAGNNPQKLSIVALRSSYELANYPETITYICANSSRTCSAIAMAGILKKGNEKAVAGILPVTARIDA